MGRVVGLLLMLGGAYMLLYYHLEWVGLQSWGPGTTPWNAREAPLDYMRYTLSESFSAVFTSGWTALTLIVLGIATVWVFRRGPRHPVD